jgi:ABC-type arginine/histidine transport system permease subunit
MMDLEFPINIILIFILITIIYIILNVILVQIFVKVEKGLDSDGKYRTIIEPSYPP